jgi:predicted RNA-binding Zn-ribbon protein involved in translation (DUF1610 family)
MANKSTTQTRGDDKKMKHQCPKCGAVESCMGHLVKLSNTHEGRCNKCGYRGKGFRTIKETTK